MAFFAPLIPLIASAVGSATAAVGTAAAAGTVAGVAGSTATALGISASVGSTLATVGNVVGALGAIGSVVSGVVGAGQQAKGYEEQAKAQQYQTNVAVNAERRNNAKVLAKQEAMGAASGLDTSQGSPLELALDTAYTGELNALMMKQQGIGRIKSLKMQASKARSDGMYDAFTKGIIGSGTMLGSFMKA
jgi:hypothetical protein